MLEKTGQPNSRGIAIGSVGSRQQKAAGLEIDRNEIVAELMRWSAYKADQRLVSVWVDKSGEVMDWLEEILARAGYETVAVPLDEQVRPGSYTYYPVVNMKLPSTGPDPQGPHAVLARVLAEHARAEGAEFHFDTAAVQLVRDESGRVTGVVAKNADGAYVQYVAERGVILCSGDYGHDPEMLAKYAPHALKVLNNLYYPPVNTGDGHKMGLWVGAAMDEAPHCALIFDIGFPEADMPEPVPLTRQPFLNVNSRGERYVNEDLPFAYICNADLQQPGGFKWVIWDDKWGADASHFQTLFCKVMKPPMHSDAALAELLASGVIKTAATLAELAQKTGLPPAMFATIERYNELARAGKDVDFGKQAACLSTIEQPPFYAVKLASSLLVTLGGLKIDTEMRVLDTDLLPIAGLSAAGNASGSFFANDYPINVSGVSHGRALTFGRLAGLNVAAARVPAAAT